MLDAFLTSMRLFLRGKLFQDPWQVFRLSLLGVAVSAALFLLLTLAGLGTAGSAGVAGLLGGALQPWLFRNLKYR